MIDLNEFAKEVHANAVAHGWYDGGERTEAEIFANIHSEWSEAFDAYAHGEPNYYHHCGDPCTKDEICENFEECYSRKIGCDGDHCFMRNKKPEGVAVELIDGVIRILDYAGYCKAENFDDPLKGFRYNEFGEITDFCNEICLLHGWTADARRHSMMKPMSESIKTIINKVFIIVRSMGLDPEKIMLEKHEYNKTRSYRHGGKVV